MNDAAIDAFIAAKDQIDSYLTKLADISADHFNTSPDRINWANVGSLNYVKEQLAEAVRFLNLEG